MNAYELADQVEMWGEDLLALNMKGGIPVTEGAKLIRQQADRIAELEKQLNTPKTYIFDGKQVWDTTPQTKPLSDVEISLIAEEFTGADGLDVVDFGRAIQERHGIK